jgi:hypothetical protein
MKSLGYDSQSVVQDSKRDVLNSGANLYTKTFTGSRTFCKEIKTRGLYLSQN